MRQHLLLRLPGIAAGALLTASCTNGQSVLQPAGVEAEQILDLAWVVFPGAVVIWIVLFGLFVYFLRYDPPPVSRRTTEAVIIGGGIVFPLVVLTALLWWTLTLIPQQREEGEGLVVEVQGEQFWWRVNYRAEGAEQPVVSANELRLPVGRRTEIKLTSAEVIHSFWVPALAGKMDMFPGRETRLALEPTRTGIFRGQCAEYCGTSHALMAFPVVVMEEGAFNAWLAEQAEPAAPPVDELAQEGRTVFLANGCGSCHTIRGTPAVSTFGPDLTHVGGRQAIGAGILPTTPEAFADWIARLASIKPGTDMPTYHYLEEQDLTALAHYLEGLR